MRLGIMRRRSAEMNCAENLVRIDAAVFHYVNLAGCRPGTISGVLGHHPKRGPITFSLRQPGAKFEPSVFLAEPARGFLFLPK